MTSGMEPSTVKRRKLDGTRGDVCCPPLLPDYQKFKGGVDRGDQLQSNYNIGRRSHKWWNRIFFYIIEVSILNAYILNSYVQPSRHAVSGRGRVIFLIFVLI